MLVFRWYYSVMSNKEAIKYYFEEAWNKRNYKAVDEVYAPDYVMSKMPPWRKPGTQGLKEFLADNHRMFPDAHNTVEDLIEEGDKVVARISGTATHKGDLVGPVGLVPTTNKKVTWRGIFIFQFKNGKVVRTWSITNNMELMQQLGAVPKPK